MLESLSIKFKASNFIKKETLTLLWNLRSFRKHLHSKAFANDCFSFSKSSISFFFFIWQILSALISTEYKVSIFLNVTTLFDQMQPYQKFNISINILIKFLLKICALLKFYFTPAKLGRCDIAQTSVERKSRLVLNHLYAERLRTASSWRLQIDRWKI